MGWRESLHTTVAMLKSVKKNGMATWIALQTYHINVLRAPVNTPDWFPMKTVVRSNRGMADTKTAAGIMYVVPSLILLPLARSVLDMKRFQHLDNLNQL